MNSRRGDRAKARTRELLVGLDLGTTVFKAAVFERASGCCLACDRVRLPVRLAANGGREQSPRGLEQALRRLLAGLRADVGARAWSRVAGMALASQGGSAVIARRDSGRPLTPMYLWNDTRSRDECAQVAASRPTGFWRARTLRDLPGLGLGRMLWLKHRRPELLATGNLYAGAGEWLFFHLTGCWQQDACNALLQGGYNARRNQLDPELFATAGADTRLVAPLREGDAARPLCKRAAARLGLSVGIPVRGPYMDHEAGYMSAKHVCARPLQCSLGTAWVGNFLVVDRDVGTCPAQLVIPAPTGKGKLVILPLLTGNVTWDWGLRTFLASDLQAALRAAGRIFAEKLLPLPGMSALPWLTAPNPLGPDGGGACFTGVCPASNRDDCLRALAAGMVFEFFRVFRAVKTADATDCLVLGGGASRGNYFRTLFAALFHPLPVHAVREPDLAGTRGALHAFSRQVARCDVERVRVPGRALRARILDHFGQYLRVFNRVCKGASGGQPLRLPDRNRRKRT